MNDVAIIDYKMGNLFSVQRACENAGLKSICTSDKQIIEKSKAIILPGVGSFAEAMKNLHDLGLTTIIKEFIDSGRPFMGICLGFQLLYSESDEFGKTYGLDVLKGVVRKFPNINSIGEKIRVPHIGWNQIYSGSNENLWDDSYIKDVSKGEYMYFVHSFYVDPKNDNYTLTITDYKNFKFCSSIENDNIFAAQFHPEKSAKQGLKIYKSFANKIKTESSL